METFLSFLNVKNMRISNMVFKSVIKLHTRIFIKTFYLGKRVMISQVHLWRHPNAREIHLQNK